jgi:hypothetical protein
MAATGAIELDIFGDESVGAEVVAYGLIAVAPGKVEDAENLLKDIKRQFGCGEDALLHCKEIFWGDVRAKGPWAHLKPNDVFQLYEQLAICFAEAGYRRVVAIARKSNFPKAVPAEGRRPEIKFDDKPLAALCGNSAIIPFSKNPGMERIRFWADPETTKIPWLGRKVQAHNALNSFVDIGPGMEPPRVKIQNITGNKPPLLQVADFVAYITQKAMSRRWSKLSDRPRYKVLFNALRPELLEISIGPDGGVRVNVPNASLAPFSGSSVP